MKQKYGSCVGYLIIMFIITLLARPNITLSGESEPAKKQSDLATQDVIALRCFTADLLEAIENNSAAEFKKTISENHDVILKILHALEHNNLIQVLQSADIPFNDSHISELISFSKISSYLPDNLLIDQFISKMTKWSNFPTRKRIDFLNKVDDSTIGHISEHVKKVIGKVSFSGEKAVRDLIDPENGIETSGLPDSFINLFNLMVNQYFDHYSNERKCRIIKKNLRLDFPVKMMKKWQCF